MRYVTQTAADPDDSDSGTDTEYGAGWTDIEITGKVGQELTYDWQAATSATIQAVSYLSLSTQLPDGLDYDLSDSNRHLTVTGTPTEPKKSTTMLTMYNVLMEQITTVNLKIEVTTDTVVFDANADDATCGTKSLTADASGTIVLPSASRDGYHIIGWYTHPTNGINVGMPGDTYKVDYYGTLYAHWEINEQLSADELVVYSSDGITFSRSPSVHDESGNEVTNYTLKVESQTDGVKIATVSGKKVNFNLNGLMAGTFHISVSIDAPGYRTGYWNIEVNSTVVYIDDPEGPFVVGDTIQKSLNLQPSSSYIDEDACTFQLNGSTAPAGSYTFDAQNRQYWFTPEKSGTWVVSLALSADGYTTYIHDFRFTVADSGVLPDPDEPPTISGIYSTKVEGMGQPNMFDFHAVGVSGNPTSIVWDFGDGESSTGSSVTHSYRQPGWYEVKCTVSNGMGSNHVETMVKATDITSSEDFADFMNLTMQYYQNIPVETANPVVTITCEGKTEQDLAWFESRVDDFGEDGYILTVIGTCDDLSFAGKTIHVHVQDGTKVIEWDIEVLEGPEVDHDTAQNASADYEVDGLTVTLVDVTPSSDTVKLQVIWGDGGQPSRGMSDGVFMHEYKDSGPNGNGYDITLTWMYYGSVSYEVLDYQLHVSFGDATTVTIEYVGGAGAQGQMDPQTGKTSYIVEECAFTKPGSEFLGWNTSPDFTGTVFMPGDTISGSGTTRLYAMWSGSSSSSPDAGSDSIALYVVVAALVAIAAVLVVRRIL